ncbi:MAG: Asp-tRNA(Asn)/Glu-tRNA(Gln) amidotransferase subunit GatA [Syntrophomonadaceae bacterium]|nr:Asp-tRNA(Asn)/Glu-tRNA(Gln) amidotransferase subunit GatA [Syntrophomonadaceae bacterium]
MELYQHTVQEIGEMLARREVTAREVLASSAERIGRVENKIQAFITLTLEEAEKTARDLEARDEIGGLAGIPCGIKDNLCTRGVRTTCASEMLENFVPPYDATAVKRLKSAGAVVVGKLNMDEFAMGSSTENSGFFPTHNPWDLTRVPGGSSGGAAAAVAAGEVYYALASDTGGSIRQPASFCGVVGMKPTYGLVSRFGLVAFASSLDQVGPITRTVTDCALVMNAICGHDSMDSTSLKVPVPDYTKDIQEGIKGLRIGFPREYFQKGVDRGVKDTIMEALFKFEELGAVVEETSLPHSEYALPTYYIIAPSEASSNLARFDGVRYGYRDRYAQDTAEMFSSTRARGFGPEVIRRVMLGTYALSSGYYEAYYLKALKVRRLIKEDFDRAFEQYDILISPTTTSTAFRIGEKAEDLLTMYMLDMLTIPVSLAGIPSISIPGGFLNNLPVGLQLMGPPLSERTLLKAAYAFEQATGYHLRTPVLEVYGT